MKKVGELQKDLLKVHRSLCENSRAKVVIFFTRVEVFRRILCMGALEVDAQKRNTNSKTFSVALLISRVEGLQVIKTGSSFVRQVCLSLLTMNVIREIENKQKIIIFICM